MTSDKNCDECGKVDQGDRREESRDKQHDEEVRKQTVNNSRPQSSWTSNLASQHQSGLWLMSAANGRAQPEPSEANPMGARVPSEQARTKLNLDLVLTSMVSDQPGESTGRVGQRQPPPPTSLADGRAGHCTAPIRDELITHAARGIDIGQFKSAPRDSGDGGGRDDIGQFVLTVDFAPTHLAQFQPQHQHQPLQRSNLDTDPSQPSHTVTASSDLAGGQLSGAGQAARNVAPTTIQAPWLNKHQLQTENCHLIEMSLCVKSDQSGAAHTNADLAAGAPFSLRDGHSQPSDGIKEAVWEKLTEGSKLSATSAGHKRRIVYERIDRLFTDLNQTILRPPAARNSPLWHTITSLDQQQQQQQQQARTPSTPGGSCDFNGLRLPMRSGLFDGCLCINLLNIRVASTRLLMLEQLMELQDQCCQSNPVADDSRPEMSANNCGDAAGEISRSRSVGSVAQTRDMHGSDQSQDQQQQQQQPLLSDETRQELERSWLKMERLTTELRLALLSELTRVARKNGKIMVSVFAYECRARNIMSDEIAGEAQIGSDNQIFADTFMTASSSPTARLATQSCQDQRSHDEAKLRLEENGKIAPDEQDEGGQEVRVDSNKTNQHASSSKQPTRTQGGALLRQQSLADGDSCCPRCRLESSEKQRLRALDRDKFRRAGGKQSRQEEMMMMSCASDSDRMVRVTNSQRQRDKRPRNQKRAFSIAISSQGNCDETSQAIGDTKPAASTSASSPFWPFTTGPTIEATSFTFNRKLFSETARKLSRRLTLATSGGGNLTSQPSGTSPASELLSGLGRFLSTSLAGTSTSNREEYCRKSSVGATVADGVDGRGSEPAASVMVDEQQEDNSREAGQQQIMEDVGPEEADVNGNFLSADPMAMYLAMGDDYAKRHRQSIAVQTFFTKSIEVHDGDDDIEVDHDDRKNDERGHTRAANDTSDTRHSTDDRISCSSNRERDTSLLDARGQVTKESNYFNDKYLDGTALSNQPDEVVSDEDEQPITLGHEDSTTSGWTAPTSTQLESSSELIGQTSSVPTRPGFLLSAPGRTNGNSASSAATDAKLSTSSEPQRYAFRSGHPGGSFDWYQEHRRSPREVARSEAESRNQSEWPQLSEMSRGRHLSTSLVNESVSATTEAAGMMVMQDEVLIGSANSGEFSSFTLATTTTTTTTTTGGNNNFNDATSGANRTKGAVCHRSARGALESSLPRSVQQIDMHHENGQTMDKGATWASAEAHAQQSLASDHGAVDEQRKAFSETEADNEDRVRECLKYKSNRYYTTTTNNNNNNNRPLQKIADTKSQGADFGPIECNLAQKEAKFGHSHRASPEVETSKAPDKLLADKSSASASGARHASSPTLRMAWDSAGGGGGQSIALIDGPSFQCEPPRGTERVTSEADVNSRQQERVASESGAIKANAHEESVSRRVTSVSGGQRQACEALQALIASQSSATTSTNSEQNSSAGRTKDDDRTNDERYQRQARGSINQLMSRRPISGQHPYHALELDSNSNPAPSDVPAGPASSEQPSSTLPSATPASSVSCGGEAHGRAQSMAAADLYLHQLQHQHQNHQNNMQASSTTGAGGNSNQQHHSNQVTGAVHSQRRQHQWCQSNTFSSSLNSDISTSGPTTKDTTEKDSSRRTSTLSGISSIYQQETSIGLVTPYSSQVCSNSTPANTSLAGGGGGNTANCSNMGSIPELATIESLNQQPAHSSSSLNANQEQQQHDLHHSSSSYVADSDRGQSHTRAKAGEQTSKFNKNRFNSLLEQSRFGHRNPSTDLTDQDLAPGSDHRSDLMRSSSSSGQQRGVQQPAAPVEVEHRPGFRYAQSLATDHPTDSSAAANIQRVAQSLRSQFRERLSGMRPLNALMNLNFDSQQLQPPAQQNQQQPVSGPNATIQEEEDINNGFPSAVTSPAPVSNSLGAAYQRQASFGSTSSPYSSTTFGPNTSTLVQATKSTTSNLTQSANTNDFSPRGDTLTSSTPAPSSTTLRSFFRSTSSAAFNAFASSFQQQSTSSTPSATTVVAASNYSPSQFNSSSNSPGFNARCSASLSSNDVFESNAPPSPNTPLKSGQSDQPPSRAQLNVVGQDQAAPASPRSPLSPISVTSTRFFALIRDKFSLTTSSTSANATTATAATTGQASPTATSPSARSPNDMSTGTRARSQKANSGEPKHESNVTGQANKPQVSGARASEGNPTESISSLRALDSLPETHRQLESLQDEYERIMSSRRPSYQRQLDEQVNQNYRMAVEQKIRHEFRRFDQLGDDNRWINQQQRFQHLDQVLSGSDLESIIRPMSSILGGGPIQQQQQQQHQQRQFGHQNPAAAAAHYAAAFEHQHQGQHFQQQTWCDSSQQSIDSSSSIRSLRSCWFSMPELYAMNQDGSSIQSPIGSQLLHLGAAAVGQQQMRTQFRTGGNNAATMDELLDSLSSRADQVLAQEPSHEPMEQSVQVANQQQQPPPDWPSNELFKQLTSREAAHQDWSITELNLTSDDIEAGIGGQPGGADLQLKLNQDLAGKLAASLKNEPHEKLQQTLAKYATLDDSICVSIKSSDASSPKVQQPKQLAHHSEETVPKSEPQKQAEESGPNSRPISQNSTISSTSCALSDFNSNDLHELNRSTTSNSSPCNVSPISMATSSAAEHLGELHVVTGGSQQVASLEGASQTAASQQPSLLQPNIASGKQQRAMSLVTRLSPRLSPCSPHENNASTAQLSQDRSPTPSPNRESLQLPQANQASYRRRSAAANMTPGRDVAPAATTLELRLAARKSRVKLTELHPITFINDKEFLQTMSSLRGPNNNRLDAIYNSPVGRRLSVNAELAAQQQSQLMQNSRSGSKTSSIKIGLTGYVYIDRPDSRLARQVDNFGTLSANRRRPSLAPNFWRQNHRPSNATQVSASTNLTASVGGCPPDSTGQTLGSDLAGGMQSRARSASCTPSVTQASQVAEGAASNQDFWRNTPSSLTSLAASKEALGVARAAKSADPPQLAPIVARSTRDLSGDGLTKSRPQQQQQQQQRRASTCCGPAGSRTFQLGCNADRTRRRSMMLERLSESSIEIEANGMERSTRPSQVHGAQQEIGTAHVASQPEDGESKSRQTLLNRIQAANSGGMKEVSHCRKPQMGRSTSDSSISSSSSSSSSCSLDKDDVVASTTITTSSSGRDDQHQGAKLEQKLKDANKPKCADSSANNNNENNSSSSSDDGDIDKLVAQYSIVCEPQASRFESMTPVGNLRQQAPLVTAEGRSHRNHDSMLRQLMLASKVSAQTAGPHGRRFSTINLYQRDEDIFVANSMKRPPTSQLQLFASSVPMPVLATGSANYSHRQVPPPGQMLIGRSAEPFHDGDYPQAQRQLSSGRRILNPAAYNQLPVLASNRSPAKSIISGTSGLIGASLVNDSVTNNQPIKQQLTSRVSQAISGVDVEEQLTRLRQQERRTQAGFGLNQGSDGTGSSHSGTQFVEDLSAFEGRKGRDKQQAHQISQDDSLNSCDLADVLQLDFARDSNSALTGLSQSNCSSETTTGQNPAIENLQSSSALSAPEVGAERVIPSQHDSSGSQIVDREESETTNNAGGHMQRPASTSLSHGPLNQAPGKSCDSLATQPLPLSPYAKPLDTIIEGRGLLLGPEQDRAYANKLRRLSGASRRASDAPTVQNSEDDWCRCDLSSPPARKLSKVKVCDVERRGNAISGSERGGIKLATPTNTEAGSARRPTFEALSMLETVKSLAKKTFDSLTTNTGEKTTSSSQNWFTSTKTISSTSSASSSTSEADTHPDSTSDFGLTPSEIADQQFGAQAKSPIETTGSKPLGSRSTLCSLSPSLSTSSLDDAENYRAKSRSHKVGHAIESSSSISSTLSGEQVDDLGDAESGAGKGGGLEDGDEDFDEEYDEEYDNDEEEEEFKVCFRCNKRIRMANLDNEQGEKFAELANEENADGLARPESQLKLSSEAEQQHEAESAGELQGSSKSAKTATAVLHQADKADQEPGQTCTTAQADTAAKHHRRRAQTARRSASMNAAEHSHHHHHHHHHNHHQHGQGATPNGQSVIPFSRRKNKWQIQRNLGPKLKRQRSFSANYAPEVPNPVMPPPRRFSAAPTLSCPHRNKSSSHSSSSLHHTYSIDSSESMITVIPANRSAATFAGADQADYQLPFKRSSRGSISCLSSQAQSPSNSVPGAHTASSSCLGAGSGDHLERSGSTQNLQPRSPLSPSRCSPNTGLLSPSADPRAHFGGTGGNQRELAAGNGQQQQQQHHHHNHHHHYQPQQQQQQQQQQQTLRWLTQSGSATQTAQTSVIVSPSSDCREFAMAVTYEQISNDGGGLLRVSSSQNLDEDSSLVVENGTSISSSRTNELLEELEAAADTNQAGDSVMQTLPTESCAPNTNIDPLQHRGSTAATTFDKDSEIDPNMPMICTTINDFCARHSREELQYLISQIDGLKVSECHFSEKSSTLCMVIEVRCCDSSDIQSAD